ncbi:hypothetical protein LTR35_014317 [Friedmanniomyces endolithicus]|nr:hypothetical protein LTR35_014317 [Friedmanniomyces endolithicus]KAK0294316.1 hypothetical protein LTS00_006906 [Friedmanniomyces endolithicus]KAK1013329.1 hypothetical protein LTR54_004236 [Friedmanniomyces endolithicus]
MTPASRAWLAFTNALHRRIEADELKRPLRELMQRHKLPGEAVARMLMGLRARKSGSDDPLLFAYARLLLSEGHLGTGDLLQALLATSELANEKEITRSKRHASGLPTCEERIFLLLAELHLTEALPVEPARMQKTTSALVRWLHVVHAREYNAQLESAGLHALDMLAYGTYEALASLTASVFGKPRFQSVDLQPWWEGRRTAVVREMRNFDVHVLQWMQSQWAGRIQALTLLPPFVEVGEDGRPVLAQQQILQTLAQENITPAAQSRAGLYIWLNACLCSKPMMDDLGMLGYLQTRYNGDNQMLTVHLLHASFDVLTNRVLSARSAHEVKVVRSFTCNKLPLLLALLASFMGQVILETCIQSAFLSIVMDPIPPISAGSLAVTEMLKRTRLEFLQACILHGVVSESTIGMILQESPSGLPKVPKYTKENLLNQCTNNVGRLESLTAELQSMRGNAGAVSLCIVDLIGTLCASKDTMSLKSVCNILINHIENMDIVMQYTQPATLLGPLCMLLKDWVHDQDQSEFTPAYEEFASMLLFTLAVLHRYQLTPEDLGMSGLDVFLFDILDESSTCTSLSDLGHEQNQQLAKWLEGLFATDDQGETSGISDEVMRQCPPQAFYKLVPTLFQQSVMACKANHLSPTILKNGLELLLEPFLLPSLVGGLKWVIGRSWEDNNEVEIILQILEKLLRPSSNSADTQAMHRAVMVTVAEPLEHSLQDLLRQRPEKTVAAGLSALLRQYVDSTGSSCHKAEIEKWAAAGDMTHEMRHVVRGLITWAANGTPTAPPQYQHQMIVAMHDISGPQRIMNALLSLMRETEYPAMAIALDVCTSVICAPSSVSNTLRQQLALEVSDTDSLLKRSMSQASTLVRLHLSVESRLVVHQLEIPFPLPQQQSTDQLMQDLGLSGPVIGADVGQVDNPAQALQMTDDDLQAAMEQPLSLDGVTAPALQSLDPVDVQLEQAQGFFGGLGMDLEHQALQNNVTSMSVQNADDDIFAGLDLSGGMGDLGEDDFNFG